MISGNSSLAFENRWQTYKPMISKLDVTVPIGIASLAGLRRIFENHTKTVELTYFIDLLTLEPEELRFIYYILQSKMIGRCNINKNDTFKGTIIN